MWPSDAGASPLFPPEQETEQAAQSALLDRLRQGPPGRAARWTLARIREHVPWLRLDCDSGLHRLLRRLGISYKRGGESVYSPDPDYPAKADYAEQCLNEARADPAHVVLLYQDEAAYYRQPTLAQDYEAEGARHQPRARRSHQSNTKRRIAACLDAVSGRVFYQGRSKAGVVVLNGLYRDVAEATTRPSASTWCKTTGPCIFIRA